MQAQLPALPWDGFHKLPDKGVVNFVRDVLRELDINVEKLEKDYPHWLPVAIVGTLDWVFLCGWWVFRNTGFYDSDESYKYVIEFNGYEFDPDLILVFREDEKLNKFQSRIDNPGLERMERSEALEFLKEDVFGGWAKSQGVDPEQFTPPQDIIEKMMWATFMWVLSDYGRDWIYNQDEILACVIEYGVAFMEKWTDDKTLLDPTQVKVTQRLLHTCRYCEKRLYCVRGAYVDGGKWQFVCVNCLVKLWDDGVQVEEKDDRIIHPPCPHLHGAKGSRKSCTATCPHSQTTKEKVWERMEAAGTARLEQYREAVKVSGQNYRQLGGQTLDDILNHFK